MFDRKRREFITLIGGAAVTWPLATYAQTMKRIGWLDATSSADPETQMRLSVFRQELQTLGWVENRTLEIIARFDAIDATQRRTHIAEMRAMAPDVIVTNYTTVISELVKESPTTPIVCTLMPDPVALGLAKSLAHPGGNVTGFTHFGESTAAKWLELLREIAPSVSRIAVLVDPRNTTVDIYVAAIKNAASLIRLPLSVAAAHDAGEIEQVVAAFAQEPNGGLIVPPGPLGQRHRQTIVEVAALHHLPAAYAWRYFVADGGLLSYGPDLFDMHRRAASYVDRILKGTKPADLPIQGPTRFQFVVNLKTARALGLSVPPTLLAIADEVIE
jgi:putative ABC transport system substrate-binding protein